MASKKEFVDYVISQVAEAGEIRAQKMFGEWAIYCDERLVGLVCEDELFVKQTRAGDQLIENPVFKPPYEGAKEAFLISEKLEDKDFMSNLFRESAKELPQKKKKKKK